MNKEYWLGSSELPSNKKLIISVALTGNVHSKEDNPNLPSTPDSIVDDACRCFDAGARVFHTHAYDDAGNSTWKKEVFEEIFSRIKKKRPGAIICASTSGRTHEGFEERSEVLDIEGEQKPDYASLSLGSLNSSNNKFLNPPEMVIRLAAKMKEKGIRPELEIFETGMINFAAYLQRKDHIDSPSYFNFILGILGSMPARASDICHMVDSLPTGSSWGAGAAGRFQLPTNASAILMGGHVRVGLEDNLYYDYEKERLATNEDLVKRLVRISSEIGRPIATAEEARELLWLK